MLYRKRLAYLCLLLAVYLTIGALTRFVFLTWFPSSDVPLEAGDWLGLLGFGLGGDIFVFGWLALPLGALVLLPRGCERTDSNTAKSYCQGRDGFFFGLFVLYVGLFLFIALAEYCFWDEFGCRFNFIAVDYLIYTNEVMGNIVESYPVVPLLLAIALLAVVISWLTLRYIIFVGSFIKSVFLSRRAHIYIFCGWCLSLVVGTLFIIPPSSSNNNILNELSRNGVYMLVSAYHNNQLDYRKFYPTMKEDSAKALLQNELQEQNVALHGTLSMPFAKTVHSVNESKRFNVIQIVVESLGSESLNERTPNINAIAAQSLRFNTMLATGTRTVRGIEALTLSIPPTPGSSIVRRPDNEGLFNVGSVFRQYGYDTAFIYGGYGYFDNMNAFFEGNGFRVVDRATMPAPAITFANTWGVCDEDLYRAALAEADANFAEGKPFYQFVLTTSNHRPFTYPAGKVDIPSGTNRSGAIKYTDYAIGEFLREAATKPWFEDTIFVIVADHTAGSAGKTVLPPELYHIPCLIYSPKNIQPQQVDTLCSQIDVPPTLLALLGWNYQSTFFGKNVLTVAPEQGRAYLGTYQLLGRLDAEGLVILEPMKSPRVEREPGKGTGTDTSTHVQQTMAVYQTAHDLFVHKQFMEQAVLASPHIAQHKPQ